MRHLLQAGVLLTYLLLVLLCFRWVFTGVQRFAPSWRPTGVLVVAAELMFTATDPLVRTARRVVPTLRLGPVQLDLGFIVLLLVVFVVRRVLLHSLASL